MRKNYNLELDSIRERMQSDFGAEYNNYDEYETNDETYQGYDNYDEYEELPIEMQLSVYDLQETMEQELDLSEMDMLKDDDDFRLIPCKTNYKYSCGESATRMYVSRFGFVYRVNGLNGTVEELGHEPACTGYVIVGMDDTIYSVHRLVAEAFCDKEVGCDVVNHLDNDPSNNEASNLEWTTQKGNMEHAAKQGRMSGPTGPKMNSKRRKLTFEQAEEIRRMRKTGCPYHKLSKLYNVSEAAIGRIVNYKTYKS